VSLGRLPTHFQINYGGGVDAPFGPTHETPLQERCMQQPPGNSSRSPGYRLYAADTCPPARGPTEQRS